MSAKNTPTRFGSTAKWFHWITAALIITLIPLGIIAHGMGIETGEQIARKALLFQIHKTLGVAAFFVALARIFWALRQEKPAPLHPERKLETFAAETVHWLLYGSLLLVPLTGWIHHAATTGFAPILWPFGQNLPFVPKSEGVAELFSALHFTFERVLAAAILLHVAGALKHHVIDRDATLKRMLPGKTEAGDPSARHSRWPLVGALVVWMLALPVGAWYFYLPGHSHEGHGHAAETHHATSHEATSHDAGHAPHDDAPHDDAPHDDGHHDDGHHENGATTTPEATGNWDIDEATLEITVTQFGSLVTGTFADWHATINFDDTPGLEVAGDVSVDISIASLTLGSVTDQAMGADYFDAANFPTARYSGEIVPVADGYRLRGTLTLKGTSKVVDFSFPLRIEGDQAQMNAEFELLRLDFGVGSNMADESTLGFPVMVKIDLTAHRISE